MPVLILLCIFGVWAAVDVVNHSKGKAPPKSKETLEKINREMIGKTKKECKQILKKYRR